MRFRRTPLIAALLVLLLIVSGCAGGGSQGGLDPAGSGSAPGSGSPGGASPGGSSSGGAGKVTLKVALLDDPSRDMYLYAWRQGIVTSDLIDLEIDALPPAAIVEAFSSKSYDVVETAPQSIVFAVDGGMDLLVLTPSLIAGGTRLFTPADSDFHTLTDLAGATVGTQSLGGSYMIEIRYLLHHLGMDTDPLAGDVAYQELPPATMLDLLSRGEIDAAILTQLPAFRAEHDPSIRMLSPLSQDVIEHFGHPSMNSLFITYGSVAADRAEELREVTRVLKASADYARANQAEVIGAIAAESGLEEDYLEYWFSLYDLVWGESLDEYLPSLEFVWDSMVLLDDAPSLPNVEEVLFR